MYARIVVSLDGSDLTEQTLAPAAEGAEITHPLVDHLARVAHRSGEES